VAAETLPKEEEGWGNMAGAKWSPAEVAIDTIAFIYS
jgi:hypothetical protein